jgi:hypothetical protein
VTIRDRGSAGSPGEGGRRRHGVPLPWLGAGTLAVVLLWLLSPESAQAFDPNPLHALGDALSAGADAVTGGISKLAVEGFGGIIKALFAWPAKIINRQLLAWLVAVPDYAIHPASGGAGGDGGNLAQLGATTSAMAFAALGAVGTVSTIRYWAAGLTGSGGVEALEGLARTVGAALLIVLWPWLFRHAADLANAAGRALLGSKSVLDDTARLLAVAFLVGVAFNILSILVAIAAALLFLALLASKIAVSAGTAVVFVGMPLALMLWPIPELAWIARTAMRMFATVLAIPLVWAVCFATFAAVGVDALSLKGAGKAVDALIMPLVAVALLWLTVSTPKTLARMALSGAAGGGGFASRTASRVVARRADAAVVQTVSALGGPAVLAATTAGRGVAAAGAAATIRGPGGQQPAGGGHQRQTPPAATAATAQPKGEQAPTKAVPPNGQQAAPATHDRGLRSPSWQEIRTRVPAELTAAAQRTATTTRADVAGAMRALSPAARQGVVGLMERHGGQIRGQMAHQAARGELEDAEREAFRALAGASPEARAHGIGDFLAATGEPIAAPATDSSATERGAGPSGAAGSVEAAPATPPAVPDEPDHVSSIPPARGNGSTSDGGAR